MPLNNQYKQIFELIPAASIILLPDAPKFTIVAANGAYLSAVNSIEKDILGKGLFEAFPGNPADGLSKGVEKLRASLQFVIDFKEKHQMQPQKYDIPIRGTTDFEIKYFYSQNNPLLDDEGNITHILHSVEDVTDEKLLENSVVFERQKFKDLYLQAPFSMCILTGPEHVFEMANPLYLELIGKEDIIGKKVKEVLPELGGQGIFQFLDDVYLTGKSFSANEMLVKFNIYGNGELVNTYVNFNYQPHRNSQGIIEGVFVFAVDVTEQVLSRKKTEESEKRYKELIQNLPIATVSSDFEGRILLYSKAAVDLWGREPDIEKDKWGGHFRLYSKDGDPLPDEYSPMAIAIKERQRTPPEEVVLERPNGTMVNVLVNPIPYKDSAGKVIGVVSVGIDITESKKAEELLRKQNQELVKTNIELDHFVYSVSHDLRSPLTSILGLISLIEEDSKEPDTLKQIKMIRSSITRLDGFIKNILSYSQNNRTGTEMEKIPIKKTIHEIVDSVCHIQEAKGISFHIDLDERQPFYSDWQRFITVLENLIANAIKHHKKDVSGRYLKIAGTTDYQELKLSISDNGIGIDPKFHNKIFEMFYRLPGSTPGSGFGLYIVKETLDKIQGKIEVQSEKGVGTTFIITLKNQNK